MRVIKLKLNLKNGLNQISLFQTRNNFLQSFIPFLKSVWMMRVILMSGAIGKVSVRPITQTGGDCSNTFCWVSRPRILKFWFLPSVTITAFIETSLHSSSIILKSSDPSCFPLRSIQSREGGLEKLGQCSLCIL